jgi:glycosyltransferase involved in cell wall biosynthesis
LAGQVRVNKKEIEIVIVDDGSTDDTPQQIKTNLATLKAFGNVQVITHKERAGLIMARLNAAKSAKGMFIAFVDKRTRPNPDYIHYLLAKKRNIVIGDVYMDKQRSPWDRVLTLIRKKLYYPYFNHPFDDIEIDSDLYKRFKNKGGGGAMLVLRDYYLSVIDKFKKSPNANDDSMLINNLLKFEPLLKTADARTLYINRTGFKENVLHVYNRGPKFVDYYIKPGTRFFPEIIALVVVLLASIALFFIQPLVLAYELMAAVALLIFIASYLSEGLVDFLTCLWVFPVLILAFVVGILKGLAMKALRRY